MKESNIKSKFTFLILLFILIIGIYLLYSNQLASNNKGKILYAECYYEYMDKYNKLTEGIDETNAYEKVPLLYNDDNKKLIEEMGDKLNEYDDKLVRYEDYYIAFFDFTQLYENLKNDFYQLEKWNELSYMEQIKITTSFILSNF